MRGREGAKALACTLASQAGAAVLATVGIGSAAMPPLAAAVLGGLAWEFLRGFASDLLEQGMGMTEASWEESLMMIGEKCFSIDKKIAELQAAFKTANEKDRKRIFDLLTKLRLAEVKLSRAEETCNNRIEEFAASKDKQEKEYLRKTAENEHLHKEAHYNPQLEEMDCKLEELEQQVLSESSDDVVKVAFAGPRSDRVRGAFRLDSEFSVHRGGRRRDA
jgi:hypothetical protein